MVTNTVSMLNDTAMQLLQKKLPHLAYAMLQVASTLYVGLPLMATTLPAPLRDDVIRAMSTSVHAPVAGAEGEMNTAAEGGGLGLSYEDLRLAAEEEPLTGVLFNSMLPVAASSGMLDAVLMPDALPSEARAVHAAAFRASCLQLALTLANNFACVCGAIRNISGVRRFVVENALMWFRDFHIDALR
ncbi:MAG: hypothetical protein EOO41_05900, partial [Methanobacteriota archaeon]